MIDSEIGTREDLIRMTEDELLASIVGVSNGNYLNETYNDMTVTDWYGLGGKASLWSNGFHYCTNKTAKKIIKSESLRFTNVKKLEDETEFYNIIDITKTSHTQSGARTLIIQYFS